MRFMFRAAPVALALVAAFSGSASAQGQKFAYIQSSVLLEQAPGRAAAESLFNAETSLYREQIKRMSDSLNVMVSAFEKRQASLTAAVREREAGVIRTREEDYQRRTRDLEAKAQTRQNELVSPILDRIKIAIEDVRVEGGYSFIFNADQGSPIVALDKNLNLTDRVLAKLRTSSAAVRPAAPTSGAPTATPSGVTRPTTPPLD